MEGYNVFMTFLIVIEALAFFIMFLILCNNASEANRKADLIMKHLGIEDNQ